MEEKHGHVWCITILSLGAALSSSFHDFALPLSFQNSLLTTIITIFLSQDHLLSLYKLSDLYAILCTTTGQGIFFSLLWVMNNYSSSQFSCIGYVFLLTHHSFHISMTFYFYSADLFTLFFNVLSLTQQISSRVYKTMHMYLFLTVDLHNIHVVSLVLSHLLQGLTSLIEILLMVWSFEKIR